MKKAMKKLMAALLAVAMVCAMAIPAFAADGSSSTSTAAVTLYTITAPNNKHTYEIYQIFTGTPFTDTTGKTTLSDIKWGKNAASGNVEGTAVSDAVLKALAAVSGTNETAILTEVEKYVNLTGVPAFTTTYGSSASVPAGYYLIKDDDNATVDSHTLYLVEVVNQNIIIQPKTDVPSVEKKVLENTKHQQDDGFGTGYNDTADYHIGDMVPFKLIGRIPDMSRYQTYKYVFHDTLCKAFYAPTKNDITVYLSDSKATLGTDITNSSTISVSTDTDGETTITVSFADLKSVIGVAKDKYIVVSYSAELNEKASIGQGTPGNTNEVYLEYSNNPKGTGTGRTPDDKVIVFTYELDVTKVDGKDPTKNLQGAKFKLLNSDQTKYARVDTTGKLNGWTTDETAATELESDENGLFKVIGLDDGTYFLKETLAPSGYNTLAEPIKLVISANTNNGQLGSGNTTELETISVTVGNDPSASGATTVGNSATGTVNITVKNNRGTTLPGTGGIGTTIFYVIGGGLMVAAAILLITKKRMENR